MILIASAMEGELEPFIGGLHDKQTDFWRGYQIYSGFFEGHNALLACTGTGKVQTALVLQHLFDSYPIQGLIYCGIAGALNPAYHIGDLVICRDCLQHDMDGSLSGSEPGYIPGTEIGTLVSDNSFYERGVTFKPAGYRLYSGRVLTGDKFVKDFKERESLRKNLFGDIVEMEGAAAAICAHINDIPWLIVRCISDQADGKFPKRFKNFLSKASLRNMEFVRHVLKKTG
ncbi:MAG: 5'-methylthioadenosine/S-adenosylhomocysteine nucleosidase [Spirochaetales bacterium]|nr:5'-methylthioadenosine/S-adenosylhomocysteine nucleosidase [Spirochaetales bacterium]